MNDSGRRGGRWDVLAALGGVVLPRPVVGANLPTCQLSGLLAFRLFDLLESRRVGELAEWCWGGYRVDAGGGTKEASAQGTADGQG